MCRKTAHSTKSCHTDAGVASTAIDTPDLCTNETRGSHQACYAGKGGWWGRWGPGVRGKSPSPTDRWKAPLSWKLNRFFRSSSDVGSFFGGLQVGFCKLFVSIWGLFCHILFVKSELGLKQYAWGWSCAMCGGGVQIDPIPNVEVTVDPTWTGTIMHQNAKYLCETRQFLMLLPRFLTL